MRLSSALAAFARVGLAVGLPAVALAQTHNSATLRYERAPEAELCPSELELRQAVAARLGYDPFAPEADLHAEVKVVREAQALRALLLIRRSQQPDQRRQLRSLGLDCGELGQAMALALSVAIDPDSLGREPTPTPTPPTSAPVVAATPRAPPLEPAPTPRPSAPTATASSAGDLQFRLGLGGHAALGAAPKLNAGASLWLSLEQHRWLAYLEPRVDLSARAEAPTGAGLVRGGLRVLGLGGCLGWGLFWPCLSGHAGVLQGDGLEVANKKSQTTFYAAAGLRLLASLPLGERLHLLPHVEAELPLTPTALQLNAVEVWRTPLVTGRAGLSLTYRLGS